MDKRTKTKLGAALAALALVIAGGGYYFFHADDDTPAYTMKMIQRSVEKHDTKTFYRMVDVDGVLDSGYDGFVEGLSSSVDASTPDAKEAVREFAQILRGSLILTLKTAIDSYVSTGDLNVDDGLIELLDRTGLNDAQVRDIKNIQVNDADRNEAFADLIIFQPGLNKEFPLHLILTRKDKVWKVTRVQNFKEYVAEVAEAERASLHDYLVKVAEINSKHEAATRDAEQRYGLILAAGNLAKKETRDELKSLIDGVLKKDWEARKQELFALHVPRDAKTLHNLYMKICDVALAAAQDYSKWLDDNNPATIKAAEEKIHQVQTLQTDAQALAKRMTS